jgi:hypothetical protein
MFTHLKQKVQSQFKVLVDNGTLFTTDPNRDEIWNTYLNAIPESERQYNNCNCCKSFLRQFGGIVGIKNNKVITLWDFELEDETYGEAVKELRRFVASLPITDHFLNSYAKLGTDKTPDPKNKVIHEHFHVVAPNSVIKNKDNIPTELGKHREAKELLLRAVNELTADSVDTVLELIGQNSLYRGNEFKGIVEAFSKVQKNALKIVPALRSNYCWGQSSVVGNAVCRIRNTAIGTLLQDLSEGKELDNAVGAFERMVAPTNYKRPTSLVTPKMVDAAKERLKELGLVGALKRRQLDSRDLTAENALYVYRPIKKEDDIFEQIKTDNVINPKSLSKVEEITMDAFISGVLPTAKSIRVLLENRHATNLVSLVGAVEEGPTLFKWGNNFSWSYAGEVADSIKERVKSAGGNIEAAIRVSLSWHNHDDLDLFIVEPNGYKIYYCNKGHKSPTGGVLDVDMNAGCGTTREPVENITWKRIPAAGEYKVFVNNFSKRESSANDFEVEIEIDGELHNFSLTNPKNQETTEVATIKVGADGTITVKGSTGTPSKYASKEQWGLKTGTFQQVNAVTLSPNHWGSNVGNKHVFFLLDGCKTDEKVRPFYNEFLKEELNTDRKVFEILGSKISVEPCEKELSGIGFSDTVRNHFFVEVEGTFKRTLKVKI